MIRHRAVVFDIDGTLLEHSPAADETYLEAFDLAFGINALSDDWDGYAAINDVGIAREILGRHFGRDCTDAELRCVLDGYASALGRRLSDGAIERRSIAGARSALDMLSRRAGVCLGLATANLREVAELILASAGLWHFFRCGGYAEDGSDKTAILGAAIARCQTVLDTRLTPGDVVFIGDHPSDFRAARDHGTHFVGMGYHPECRARLRVAGADWIVGDVTELAKLLVDPIFFDGATR